MIKYNKDTNQILRYALIATILASCFYSTCYSIEIKENRQPPHDSSIKVDKTSNPHLAVTSNNQSSSKLESVKIVSDISTSIIITLIAILSFYQASRSIFSPIRTETFKLQLEAYREVISYFQNKSEHTFIENFDLEQICAINSYFALEDYISYFFEETLGNSQPRYAELTNLCFGGIATQDYASKNFKLAGALDSQTEPLDQSSHNNPWNEYEYGMIRFTKQFNEQLNIINNMSSSPIIPSKLRKLLIDFINISKENLTTIGSVLTDFSRNMPTNYPSPEEIKKFTALTTWHIFNLERKEYEPTAKQILNFIENHLDIENTMKHS